MASNKEAKWINSQITHIYGHLFPDPVHCYVLEVLLVILVNQKLVKYHGDKVNT